MSLLNANLPPQVRIVADDLTGACDAAAPFAGHGAATQVLLAAPYGRSAALVQSFCTASRDTAAHEAMKVIQTLVEPFAADRNAELLKKVDSVFRGNTLSEIAAAIDAAPGHLAVIAPAFPAQGRLCADGQLHRTDAAGSGSLNLRELFSAACLNPLWSAPPDNEASLAESMRQTNAIFCEATTQQHLRIIVQAARSLRRPILWIGSAGLADALAEALYPDAPPPIAPRLQPARLLVLSGSQHHVTACQLTALAAGTAVLRVHPIETSDDDIRAFVYAALDRDPVTLLLNGGDTALRICHALGISSLCLQGEYAPGIPVATARGGRLQGTQILLKSGGFGEANLFTSIARNLQA